ncbi:phage protease [Pelagimonas varians]
MAHRDNGLWGKVQWNARGSELMADRAYRGFSPVLKFDPTVKTRVATI